VGRTVAVAAAVAGVAAAAVAGRRLETELPPLAGFGLLAAEASSQNTSAAID